MTETEKQQIISLVLQALKTNCLTIETNHRVLVNL